MSRRCRYRFTLWLLVHTKVGRAVMFGEGLKWFEFGRFCERKAPVTPSIVLVKLESGLVVQHTYEEWLRLIKGVDVEAAMVLGKPSG